MTPTRSKANVKKPQQTILLLGSGALKIGEAGEFDYSGSQALKVLREKGYRTVLVNPNIATVQTSEILADKVYFTPVRPEFVETVIKKEKPFGIMLAFGGQTALNCGIALENSGILKRHGVRVLGTPVEVIEATEDRKLFAEKLREIGVLVARSKAVKTIDAGLAAAKTIGYPVMARGAFALGGLGSGISQNEKELRALLEKAFSSGVPQVLIEESLYGWKEIEYEVVRDGADNCITVCNMENFDPLGVHTGESIVIAPSQTLTNEEYHYLREIAIKTIRHLGVVGECNIQYAFHPDTGEYRVIEVNARLSRSSALASKATGYPLAAVAARIALGETLPEITNAVTGVTSACFEPALDYVVVKIPRWDLKKFKKAKRDIGSAMKSVGEVMAIGRTFEEAFQKAIRMIGRSWEGAYEPWMEFTDLADAVRRPSENRVFAVTEALAQGWSVERVYELSRVNPWFLRRLAHIVDLSTQLKGKKTVDAQLMRQLKQAGFSDRQIARLQSGDKSTNGIAVERVRRQRIRQGVTPLFKRIDTLAGEFPAQTNYLYATYNATAHDLQPVGKRSVVVLGSGVYRIGSSVEFDWSCVQALHALRGENIPSIIINYNPETVSTDYDESDRLYFEELSAERVRDITDFENPRGVIVSMGGQMANNLVMPLHRAGVPILGTTPANIDCAEDRHKFSSLLDRLDIDQPRWQELSDLKSALRFAKEIGYPLLVRPSYVLSGAAMEVVHDDDELRKSLTLAADISPEHPVVISEFLLHTKEMEFDGVAVKGKVVQWAIAEHVEHAGVHSGDATLVYPPQKAYRETIFRMQRLAAKIAEALEVTGPFNIQFLAKNNWLKVIECNVRASRSFPFVSKVGGFNLSATATKAVLGLSVKDVPPSTLDYKYVGVKAPQFSFARLPGADPISGVEMASTGEVACIGTDVYDAFLQAYIATGARLPEKTILLSISGDRNRYDFLGAAEMLHQLNFTIYATENTSRFLTEHKIPNTLVNKISTSGEPNVQTLMQRGVFGGMIVVTDPLHPAVTEDQYVMRRLAIDLGISLVTNLSVAKLLVESMTRYHANELSVTAWQDWR
jgi:carbamoyl-phosphate synthase large subunit